VRTAVAYLTSGVHLQHVTSDLSARLGGTNLVTKPRWLVATLVTILPHIRDVHSSQKILSAYLLVGRIVTSIVTPPCWPKMIHAVSLLLAESIDVHIDAHIHIDLMVLMQD
jgi:hypothetical protein